MTLDDLAVFGANVHEGLVRCMNNEGFYLQLAESIKGEEAFDALRDAIAANDLDAAFEIAHSLKGILANLAITPLFEPVSEITELLRSKEDADYPALVDEILRRRDEFRAL